MFCVELSKLINENLPQTNLLGYETLCTDVIQEVTNQHKKSCRDCNPSLRGPTLKSCDNNHYVRETHDGKFYSYCPICKTVKNGDEVHRSNQLK